MFTAFLQGGSPARSEYLSPSRPRSDFDRERSIGSTASPTNSVASSMTYASSAASTGVKTRQIRDLKLALEMKDGQIHELEEAYEELQRQADFTRGELEGKLENQEQEVTQLKHQHHELETVIATQAKKIEEVTDTLEQYKQMQMMMQTLMSRCQELEATQRAQEEQRRRELEVIAEEKRRQQEEAAAAAAEAQRLLDEEAEAKRIVDDQVRRANMATPQNGRLVQQTAAAAPACSISSRPSPLQRFRPSSAPAHQRNVPTKRDCCVM